MIAETIEQGSGVEVRLGYHEAKLYGLVGFGPLSLRGLRFRWQAARAASQPRPTVVCTHPLKQFRTITDHLATAAAEMHEEPGLATETLVDVACTAGRTVIESDLARDNPTA